MNLINIPKRRAQVLINTAARYEGINDARSHADSEAARAFYPNNNLGAIVCDAWRIEPQFALDAVSAYYGVLSQEASRSAAPLPSIIEVIEGMRQAVTGSLSPDIDVDKLLDWLREVPALRGA